MDDFNTSVLSEAKNEYSSRLVSILTAPIMQGFQAIFKEAWELCLKNEEDSKYLMTFQNFLTRVPRWNQEIINVETKRIIETSKCSYLEDLLTCVHITQLKILTSIRVSNQQKKIDIDIPKLHDYIHKVYIAAARKIYQNVYLFEENILPLDKQKNMRECETIIKETILNTIRENMPIEKILRAYMDETTEEEVVEEVEKVPVEDKEEEADKKEADKKEAEEKAGDKETETKKVETVETNVTKAAETSPVSSPATSPVKTDLSNIKINTATIPGVSSVPVATSTPSSPSVKMPASPPSSPSKISFNDKDHIVAYSDKENPGVIAKTPSQIVSAPKTIERLERISTERNEQRKLEEADEDDEFGGDSIKIHTGGDVKLDALDIQDISSGLQLNNKPDLTGVEVLA